MVVAKPVRDPATSHLPSDILSFVSLRVYFHLLPQHLYLRFLGHSLLVLCCDCLLPHAPY